MRIDIFFFLYRMFVTEGKKGEIELVQKAGERIFSARVAFFFLKYGVNRIYMWVERSGVEKEGEII